MTTDELKTRLWDFIHNGGGWSQDESLQCFENANELRQISLNEQWDEWKTERLEHYIESGKEVKYFREQTAKYEKYFLPIWEVMVNLSSSWQSFRLLFTDQHCEVDGLRQCLSGSVGQSIRSSLFNSVLQLITKILTDNSEINGRKNLTLEQLIMQTVDNRIPFIEKLNKMKKLPIAKNIQKWRHKIVSHFDMDRAMGKAPLPSLKFADIDALISEMQDLFNLVGTKVHNKNYMFDYLDSAISQIENANNIAKNGQRLRWLSKVSSHLTNRWDRKNGLYGSLLIHPAIIEAIQKEENAKIMAIYAENSFVDLTKIIPENTLTNGMHKSPF